MMMIMIINQIGMLTKNPNTIPLPPIKSSFSTLDFWMAFSDAIFCIIYTLIRVKDKVFSKTFLEFQRRVLSLTPVSTVPPADFLQKAEVG
jgi:hypothetical protein